MVHLIGTAVRQPHTSCVERAIGPRSDSFRHIASLHLKVPSPLSSFHLSPSLQNPHRQLCYLRQRRHHRSMKPILTPSSGSSAGSHLIAPHSSYFHPHSHDMSIMAPKRKLEIMHEFNTRTHLTPYFVGPELLQVL